MTHSAHGHRGVKLAEAEHHERAVYAGQVPQGEVREHAKRWCMLPMTGSFHGPGGILLLGFLASFSSCWSARATSETRSNWK